MPVSAQRQRDCHHRWTVNGACAKPGCHAIREPGAPLKKYETMNAAQLRNRFKRT